MAFKLNGFSDAILGQLSQIGVEMFSNKENDDAGDLTPKAIYEISTGKKINNQRNMKKKND